MARNGPKSVARTAMEVGNSVVQPLPQVVWVGKVSRLTFLSTTTSTKGELTYAGDEG